MQDFPIEDYQREIPTLRRRAQIARNAAIWWSVLGAGNLALFALAGHSLWNMIGFGVMEVSAFVAAAYSRGQHQQADLIKMGGRPTGVHFQLLKQRDSAPIAGFADQVAEIRAEAEDKAEDVKSQWWRQPGSVWHDTQQWIDATDEIFFNEAQARARELALKLKQDQEAERVRRQIKLNEIAALEAEREKERKIAATKRWMEEQKEWDAFKQDAEQDAAERKERGDWYDPPLGIPGAVYEADSAEDRVRKALDDARMHLGDRLLKYATGGYIEPQEIRAWGSVDPVRLEPAADPDHCSRAGKRSYTGPQAYAILQNMRQCKSYPCGDHYHLIKTR